MIKKILYYTARITFLTLVLSPIVWSCANGRWRGEQQHPKRNPKIEAYRRIVNDISDGKLGDYDIIAGFTREDSVQGSCNFSWLKPGHEIDINPYYWNRMTSMQRIVLLAHEYIHCECAFWGHINEDLEDGCAAHVMNQYGQDKTCVKNHYELYYEQIKKGCPDRWIGEF